MIQPLRDHPRVCGEHYGLAWRVLDAQGSSPRVRGTREQLQTAFSPSGIIPACAGNTGSGIYASGLTWDHPRVCGEHKASSGAVRSHAGSSPRVRGTP